jgi:hypothetical protein
MLEGLSGHRGTPQHLVDIGGQTSFGCKIQVEHIFFLTYSNAKGELG